MNNGMTAEERQRLVADLAAKLQHCGLGNVALLLARTFSGLGVVVSHLLLITQPLAPHDSWRRNLGLYSTLLEEPESWQTLIDHLDAPNS